MWIFGYGSIIWRPDFEYNRRVIACVKGYKRRFWYRYVRVRGTLEKPGRVATVLEDPDECVWGMAYEVLDERQDAVKNYLINEREMKVFKDAYIPSSVTFHPQDTSEEPKQALTFLNNDQFHLYIGDAGEPLEETAEAIRTAVGPTGLRNDEYLFKLADFLRDAHVEDKYIFELEQLIKNPSK